MNTFFSKRMKGFTSIELMIVLVIVAILVALAYPSYIQYESPRQLLGQCGRRVVF